MFPSFPRYKEGTGGRGQIEPGPPVIRWIHRIHGWNGSNGWNGSIFFFYISKYLSIGSIFFFILVNTFLKESRVELINNDA